MNSNISFVFWNIDGAFYRINNDRYNKLEDPDNIHYLSQHDIICLAETHCNYGDNLTIEGYDTVKKIRPKPKKCCKTLWGVGCNGKKEHSQRNPVFN